MSDTEVVETSVSDDAAPAVESVETSTDAVESVAPAAPVAAPDSVYHAFRTLPQFAGSDDRAIASRLYEALQREQSSAQALQQYQSVIPYASEYLSNKELFDQWKATRNQQPAQGQAPPAQQEAPAGWWNPPKVREAYLQYMTKDESGRDVISADAPLDAKHALAEMQTYKADFAKKFLSDPEAALGPMVQRVAEQKAQQIVHDQISTMQEQHYVSTLEKDNADWLKDASGNVSREGLAVQKYIEDAKGFGINGAEARWNYAVAMVERDLLNQNYQMASQRPPVQQQAPVPQVVPPQDTLAQRNMEYLRAQASRVPSQTTPTSTDPRVPKPSMTLAQKFAQGFSAEGLH